MTSFRVVNVRANGRRGRAGVVVDDEVFDAAELTGVAAYASIHGFLDEWAAATGAVQDALASGRDTARSPLSTVELLAPIPPSASIYGAGANYYGHAREMAAHAGRPAPADPRTTGQRPWHFLKAPSTVVGEGTTVTRPAAAADTLDWEVELAAVIGIETKNVGIDQALRHVAGYTVANDLSARGLLWRKEMHESSPFRADWMAHKNFDGACSLGPWLVPASQLGDPQDLALGLRVNGAVMQAERTSDMIFTTAEQIAHLSSFVTLRPGDVILTGTPGGVGSVHGTFLAPGDVVEAWVEGIGTLTTHIA